MWKRPWSVGQRPGFAVKGRIGSVDQPPAQAFSKRYVEKNRPVVVKGALEPWSATDDWSDDWLSRQDQLLETVVSRNGLFPDYQTSPSAMTKQDLSLAQISARIREGSQHTPILERGECYYVYGSDQFFQRDKDLARQVPPPACIAQNQVKGPFFWLSSPGSITPLHYDLVNGVLAQIRGSKKVYLFAPDQQERLYQRGSYFPGLDNRERQSQVDIFNPDLAKFPKFADAEAWEVTLEPGDMLFLPSTWWHEVVTTEFSISVGFNFAGGTSASKLADAAEKAKSGALDPESLAKLVTEMINDPKELANLQKRIMEDPSLREALRL